MIAISLCFSSLAILNEALKQFRATIQEEAIMNMAKRECHLQNHSNSEAEPELNVMEDNEEDDEGEDLPDSLGAFVKEDIQDPDDPDPIAEFQRTVSF